MLRINRLKIEIEAENGIYGFDESFTQGLNFIASENNTSGKSSIITAIYYCLGFEEIIGGRGGKVLTSVYKSIIEDGEKVLAVLKSGAYLEVTNGEEVITIFRAAKKENRDTKLITVYFSDMNNIHNSSTFQEDMYVHMPNAARNRKGFHKYLESFLNIELPLVPATDDETRKLYLQLVFSGMFIEQKHGWSDILSGMPMLGIKESKKRVLEFILHLDTLENEKKKEHLKTQENQIKREWETLIKELLIYAKNEDCEIRNIPLTTRTLSDEELSIITINKNDQYIVDYISALQEEYDNLSIKRPKVVDNFNDIHKELNETENTMSLFEEQLQHYKKLLFYEDSSLKNLKSNIEIIDSDIRNNKDSARLRNLGSNLNISSSKDICPVCNQTIQDTLIPSISDAPVMSIDENLRHLNAQKDMLEFAHISHLQNKEKLKNRVSQLENSLFKLRSLAKSLRNDLYATDDTLSESVIYKRLQLETEINSLNKLINYLVNQKLELDKLSTRWSDYLESKSSLPTQKFTKLDEEKLKTLRNYFISNLRLFGYKSVADLNQIDISTESYLPLIEGFDMKFDSSASDNIRAIWAFILALLQTSNDKSGNHPSILIFDEPAQHSIVTNDMLEFFKKIISLKYNTQIIVGITIKDSDTKQAIRQLPSQKYNLIYLPYKAFRKLN